MIRILLIIILPLIATLKLTAQCQLPFHWESDVAHKTGNTFIIKLTVSLEREWHIYSLHLEDGGPLPTRVIFDPNPAIQWIGPTREEGKRTATYDSTFLMPITWFSGRVTFYRKVKLNTPHVRIHGHVEFMVCNRELCLPPHKEEFSVEVDAGP